MRAISKRFPGVDALREVDFALVPGQVHALLGENGAGKSTLMGVLMGLVRPDSGSVLVYQDEHDPKGYTPRSPREALALGVGMVHQRLLFSERHTALENLVLGWRHLPQFVRPKALRSRVSKALADFSLDLDAVLDAPMHTLPVGIRQQVEIARSLLQGARILILDEPTAVLSPPEITALFALVRTICRRGGGIVFISHKLDEVLSVADDITVLRRGRNVFQCHARDTDAATLAAVMVGADREEADMAGSHRATSDMTSTSTLPEATPVVELEGVSVGPDRADRTDSADATNTLGQVGLEHIDLTVSAGQIFAIAGVSGSGQQPLAALLTGLQPPTRGRLRLFGRERSGRDCNPADFARDGVAYIPADRDRAGAAPTLDLLHNFILRRYRSHFTRRGLLNYRGARQWTQTSIAEHHIVAPGPHAQTSNLSGGNLQKLIIARELAQEPTLIVAAYPFRGLDMRAVNAVRDQLHIARDRGAAIVLISEDLEQILRIADTVAVLFRGRIVGQAPRAHLTLEQVGQWMGGHIAEGEVSS